LFLKIIFPFYAFFQEGVWHTPFIAPPFLPYKPSESLEFIIKFTHTQRMKAPYKVISSFQSESACCLGRSLKFAVVFCVVFYCFAIVVTTFLSFLRHLSSFPLFSLAWLSYRHSCIFVHFDLRFFSFTPPVLSGFNFFLISARRETFAPAYIFTQPPSVR